MEFVQLVAWIGTVLGDASPQELESYFEEELGFHVKYEDELEMVGEYDGIHFILFRLASEDIPKFSMFRLTTTDMKWFEDWVDNHRDCISEEVLEKYADYLND